MYEIVSDHDRSTYRAVYIVNISTRIYVLHAFQKKSKIGIKTPREDLSIIKERLQQVRMITEMEPV